MQIFVKTLDGMMALKVESYDTINIVKTNIQKKRVCLPLPSYYGLIFAGKHMEDCNNVAYYNIQKESTLEMFLSLRGGTMIKVMTLTGKEIEVEIEPTDTIHKIKERVEQQEGIPPIQQRLIYGGKQLNDKRTVEDYNIRGGSVVHIVLALRGGGF